MGALADNPTPEPPRRFTLADGTVWERTGYCNRCGDCCVGVAHSATVEPSGRTPVGYCGAFVWDDKSQTKGYCLDRCGRYYSMGCVDFPSHPNHVQLLTRCSYIFTQVL